MLSQDPWQTGFLFGRMMRHKYRSSVSMHRHSAKHLQMLCVKLAIRELKRNPLCPQLSAN